MYSVSVPLYDFCMTTLQQQFAGCKFHYAALRGSLMVVSPDGKDVTPTDLSTWHDTMSQFTSERTTGNLVLDDIVNYGHALCCGGSGKVQIFRWKT